MASKKAASVNGDLEAFISDMMKDARDPAKNFTLKDKLEVANVALKLEVIKARVKDDTFGAGFEDDDE